MNMQSTFIFSACTMGLTHVKLVRCSSVEVWINLIPINVQPKRKCVFQHETINSFVDYVDTIGALG